MKKIVSFFIFLFSILLVSCNSTNQIQNIPTVATIVATVGTSETNLMVSTASETNNATTKEDIILPSTSVQTPIVETKNFDFHITEEYGNINSIAFEKIYKYKPSYANNDKEWYIHNGGQKNIQEFNCENYTYFSFVVAGISSEIKKSLFFDETKYYVFTGTSKLDFFDESIHTINLQGTPSELCYGYFRYRIGEKYLAVCSKSYYEKVKDEQHFGLISNTFKIDEIDGVYWVYPNYYADFSYMKCAVKITDGYENMFYKPGRDDDIIEFLEENNIPNPTFDYKCELGAFIDEISNTHLVDTKNVTPVGDYTNILESFPFESFAEYPENLRMSDEYPYLTKRNLDITCFQSTVEKISNIIVTVLGYIGEELGEEGMIYSYYYVYIEPVRSGRNQCYDDTVYIMKAYGSPSHPYFGQKRMEVGDRFLRLETDKSFIQKNSILDATKLFYITESDNGHIQFAFPDFATDFSKVNVGVLTSYPIKIDEKPIYVDGRDDGVIVFMKENDISPPEYSCKAWVLFFIDEINKNGSETK